MLMAGFRPYPTFAFLDRKIRSSRMSILRRYFFEYACRRARGRVRGGFGSRGDDFDPTVRILTKHVFLTVTPVNGSSVGATLGFGFKCQGPGRP